MALIRPNPKRVDTRFLHFYFFSPAWRSVIRENTLVGSTVDRIPLTRFPTFPVHAPPLPVQRRVAAILSAYDDLIGNCERRIRILEEMARALYRAWFVYFRYRGHQESDLVSSSLGRIPRGWTVKSVGELIEFNIGGGWGSDTTDTEHTEPAWVIRGTDIPEARHGTVTSVPYRFHTPSNIRARVLRPFDIVFETSGGSKEQPVGRSLLVTEDLLDALPGTSICASFCKKIRPLASEYDPLLLYLSLLEGYDSGELSTYQVQSTGISNFKWSEYIASVRRAVPPPPLQAQFRQIAEPWFALMGTLGREASHLRKTRDLLLPRLFSGQLDAGELQ